MRIVKYTTQLVKEQSFNYDCEALNSEAVYQLLDKVFNASRRCEEHTWEICINAKGRVVGLFELATGGMAGCMLDAASVARNALLVNAYGVMIAHNHPSGDPAPSKEDRQVTAQIKAGLKLLGLHLLDHVVIGDGTHYSFANCGEI